MQPALLTVTLKRSQERVVVERLGRGLYRSGCRRYLFVDRGRDGEQELVNHRCGRYAIRRVRQGWQTFDLESCFTGLEPKPYPLYCQGYPETLAGAVQDVPRRQELIEREIERGTLERRQFAVAEALEATF